MKREGKNEDVLKLIACRALGIHTGLNSQTSARDFEAMQRNANRERCRHSTVVGTGVHVVCKVDYEHSTIRVHAEREQNGLGGIQRHAGCDHIRMAGYGKTCSQLRSRSTRSLEAIFADRHAGHMS